MRNGSAEWVVHWVSSGVGCLGVAQGWVGSGVGCSWQSDWLRGGSFIGSVTMKNESAEWDGSSFAEVG